MILDLSESAITMVGGLVAIGSVVGGALFATGRRQGKTEEKLGQITKDTGELREHQRRQDTQCSQNVTRISSSVSAIESSVAGVVASVEKVEKDVREIRQCIMKTRGGAGE